MKDVFICLCMCVRQASQHIQESNQTNSWTSIETNKRIKSKGKESKDIADTDTFYIVCGTLSTSSNEKFKNFFFLIFPSYPYIFLINMENQRLKEHSNK